MVRFAKARLNSSAGISAVALALAAMVARPALAQTTSIIQGRVEGAAAGTTVTATDAATGERYTSTTNAGGDYTIVGIRASTYHVEVKGKPTQDVVVPIGQTITQDFGRPDKDTIVVNGRRRQQEVRTAEVATNITTAQIENLPQDDRNFLNFAALAPGVTVTPNSGARQIQAGATSADNINVYIDGLSFKNSVNHGGVVGQQFSRGNPFPQAAIQEFKVDTQNFKAEYEQAGSAIITAVTKTGGEEFHGEAFGEWQPKDFVGQPFFDRPGHANNLDGKNPKPDFTRWQYGAAIGGPVIKDKLHFFFAFEGTTETLPSATVNLGSNAGDNIPPAISTQYNRSYPQKFDQQLYFGKLSLFATAQDTIDASVFIRKENNLSDYGGNAIPTHGHDLLSDVETYQLEWKHRTDHWLNEATFAYNLATNGTPRVSTGPEIILTRGMNNADGTITPTYDSCCVAFLGNNAFVQNDRQEFYTIKDNLTFHNGNHIVKGGVRLAFTTLERREDNLSNGSYRFNAATYTNFADSIPIGAQISTIDIKPARAKNTQVGVFIQDDWTPNEHWTVNAGIRWDYESNAKNESFVTPDNIAAALRAYPGWQAAGINPENYISNGHNRSPDYFAIQPRIGVSYDFKGDRDIVAFAGFGRYYDRPLFIDSGLETIQDLYERVSTIRFCNAGGATPNQPACTNPLANTTIPYNPNLKDINNLRAAAIAQNLGGSVWLLNNNTKLPFSDQIDFGIRKRFGQIQTSLSYSHIYSYNIFKYVRGNRLPNGTYTSQGDQWIEDNFPVQGQLAGFNGKLNIGTNEGRADYDAIYLTAEKPFNAASKWGFTQTLTLQFARSNVAQELQSDEFYNGPRQDAYGWQWTAGVDRWRYVGTAIARAPWQTTISGTLTLASGPAFGNVIFKPNPPENACCYGNFGGKFYPKDFFGYATLDMRIAKNIPLPYWHHSLTVDFQAYNIFDWVNRFYSAWGAGGGTNPTLLENGTVGQARSFQAGVKYKF